uniref:Uncharacterized protein n=1 Tax=Pavo cristatus TaxID=9049 RepID=A0A8C9FZD7_PAVCR
MDISFAEGVLSPSSTEMRPEPPNSLDLNGTHPRRIKLTAPNINLSLDESEGSILSDDNLDTPDEIDINVDDLDTPDEADSFEYTGQGSFLECRCRIRLCFFVYSVLVCWATNMVSVF